MNADPVLPPLPPASEPPPRRRGWFVGLTWVTLVLFALFILVITVVAARIPQIKKARQFHGEELR